jgi:hypothetical protein
MMRSSQASQGAFDAAAYTKLMHAVLEQVATAMEKAEQISAEAGESPEVVRDDLNELASHIAPLPARLKEMAEVTKEGWLRIALPVRLQGIAIANVLAEFAAVLRRVEVLAPILGPNEAAAFLENVNAVTAAIVAVQSAINERIEVERRMTASLKADAKAEAQSLSFYERSRREIDEGRGKTYTLEEFKQRFK